MNKLSPVSNLLPAEKFSKTLFVVALIRHNMVMVILSSISMKLPAIAADGSSSTYIPTSLMMR
jgi:hypothetical protein